MPDLTQQQREFFDVLARLIDAPLQSRDEENLTAEQRVESRLKQLPYSVEHAVVAHLHRKAPDLFADAPSDRFSAAIYNDATEDLANVGTYYHGRSFLIDYQFSEKCALRSEFGDHATVNSDAFAQVDEWMQQHGLFEASEDNPDPHFAERAFVVNVFVPAFGVESLRHLQPQKHYYQYFVDFELAIATGRVIIEIDSREYHDPSRIPQEDFEYELKRQNDLQALGIPLLRFPVRRILQEPATVVQELKRHVDLPRQLNLLPLAEEAGIDQSAAVLQFASALAQWFRPVQLSLLLSLSRSLGKNDYAIADRSSDSTLLFLAAHDLICLAHRLQQLYGIVVDLPRSVRILSPQEPTAEIVNAYLESVERGPDGFATDGPANRVISETVDPAALPSACDLIFDLAREGRIPLVPEGGTTDVLGRECKNLSTLRARLKALTLKRPGVRNSLRPQCLGKRLIDYFARRLLRIPALYHHHDPRPDYEKTEERQYELVMRVLRGLSVFGIMPTGRGKSVAFQLPAFLFPGGALVVSPLRALMRDQLGDLRLSRAVNAVEAIRYGMIRSDREQAIEDFLYGYTKLLYVSPERLQEIRFSSSLAEAAAIAHVSFVAIDEAHCVSEWGHDFRLSYMHIPSFMDDLRQAQEGVACPIVALTATASPPVRLDVCTILDLNERDVRVGGDFLAEANIDRTELSLSVHKITGVSYPADRQNTLKEILSDVLPVALQRNHGVSDWREIAQGGWNGSGAGVVFCLYKDSHGQRSWHECVGAVRDYLLAEDLIPKHNVQLYAADSPGYCPECLKDGQIVYSLRGLTRADMPDDDEGEMEQGFECINGHRFTQAEYDGQWDSNLGATQHRFKKNAFPLLIATKAYGMGIDHRGLRFVIHYGLPSSLEAYYQEIGRAGRDDRQAHCALMVRLPAEGCVSQHLERPLTYEAFEEGDDSEILPPCMTGSARTRRQCPPHVGLPEPCDLSRQLMLMLEVYKKPDGFAQGCAIAWASVVVERSDAQGSIRQFIRGGGLAGEKRVANHHNYLYRLYQLGIVDGFRLEYVGVGDHFDTRFHVWPSRNVSRSLILHRLAEWLLKIRRASAAEGRGGDPDEADSLVAELNAQLGAEMPLLAETREVDGPFVRWAVRKLFGAVRAHVIKMRLESFAKLHRYVESDDNCRRLELLGGMTGQAYGDDTHTCAFCDSRSCVPDRRFTSKRARPTADSTQFRDLLTKASNTIDTQDMAGVTTVVSEADRRHCLVALGHHATTHLESFPDNLAANYLAAESYRGNPDRSLQKYAHRYYRQYARIANVERQDVEASKRGYEAYQRFDSAEAIRVYAVPESALDNVDDLGRQAADAGTADIERGERDNLNLAAIQARNHTVMDKLRANLSAVASAIDDF
jgi:ATP-dependent DNA helicase RecQ